MQPLKRPHLLTVAPLQQVSLPMILLVWTHRRTQLPISLHSSQLPSKLGSQKLSMVSSDFQEIIALAPLLLVQSSTITLHTPVKFLIESLLSTSVILLTRATARSEASQRPNSRRDPPSPTSLSLSISSGCSKLKDSEWALLTLSLMAHFLLTLHQTPPRPSWTLVLHSCTFLALYGLNSQRPYCTGLTAKFYLATC